MWSMLWRPLGYLMNLFCSNGAKVEYKHKIYKDICTEDHSIARAELYMGTTDLFFFEPFILQQRGKN